LAKKPLLQELRELRAEMAAAAQKVYDEWTQDAEGVDEELGTGGICDKVSEEVGNVVASNVPDVAFDDGGSGGEDHAWVIVSRDGEAYGVDIAPEVYERGGGYCWRKLPNVRFDPDHVEIFEVPFPREGLEMGSKLGVSEGGTNLQGNRFEADVSPNKARADIKDRKGNRLFTLLSREDIMELHELTGELKLMMWKHL
jgi:hypothetical protein